MGTRNKNLHEYFNSDYLPVLIIMERTGTRLSAAGGSAVVTFSGG